MLLNNINAYNYSPKISCTKTGFKSFILPEIKDYLSFSGNRNVQYVDESIPLLDGYTKRPMENFRKLSPDKMCLVHMTDYFPYDGEIKPVNIVTKDGDGKAEYRSTVHFAINHSVKEHDFGYGWQTMKYAVILPMDRVFEQTEEENLLGGRLKDFYIKGCVKIPDNSIIVKYNPKIQEGKLKITDASKTMEDFKGTKGIKIIETSTSHTGEIADIMVSKAGYTNLNEITQKCSGLTEEEYKILSDTKYSHEFMQRNPQKWYNIQHNPAIQQKAANFRALEEKSWSDFTRKYNLSDKNHANSPWARSEALIECIKFAGAQNNSWTAEFLSESGSHFDKDEIEELADICSKADEYSYEELTEAFDKVFDTDTFGEIFDTEEMTEEQLRNMLKSMNPIRKINYKQEFLKIIDEIKKDLPEGKTLSFDIDILKEIIEEAKTPDDALGKIENRLNLKPMVPPDRENEDFSDNSMSFKTIDMIIGITDIQKQAIANNAAATLI